MSQKHQQTDGAAGSTCPSCAEPLESGDLFCGACGYDLSALTATRQNGPTGTTGAAEGSEGSENSEGSEVEWPVAPEVDSSDVPAPVHLPTDLAGTDSGGTELPDAEPESEPEGLADFDEPSTPSRRAAQLDAAQPDPRTATPTP
ncbi:zinc ribbon domain-containing protein, partial [Streptomyces boluensis]